jgi:hypothetical protein
MILLMAFVIMLPFAGHADDEIAAAQNTIRSQTEAIVRNDGAAAYAFASPALQLIFQQPDIFMAMVQKNYAPIYRHNRFDFGESRISEGKIAQKVDIVDADGEPWTALYTLERQDGVMKITGCTLVKETGA